MSDLRNLGVFATIDALWAAHPEGGQEGDYCFIGASEAAGVKHRWNKYERIWENAATVTESTGRHNEVVDGDFTANGNMAVGGNARVTGDLHVGGTLHAGHVKQPNLGLFPTLAALKAAYPEPAQEGLWAVIGDTVPGPIYIVGSDGTWSATGETGGVDDSPIEDVESLKTRMTAAEAKNAAQDAAIAAINALLDGDATTAIETLQEVLDFLDGIEDADTLAALLTDLQSKVADGYAFKGIASPAADGATVLNPEQPECYLLLSPGTYWQFGYAWYRSTGQQASKRPFVVLGANDIAIAVTEGNDTPDFYHDGGWSLLGYEALDIAKKSYVDAIAEAINDRLDNIGEELDDLNVPAAIYNPTVENQISGYYTLCDQDHPNISAVHVAKANGKAVIGLLMSFAISQTVWKTYQFVGLSTEDVDWYNTDNWKDFGSLAAGSENYIIIDNLCGAPAGANFYTLGSAVERLIAYQQSSGVTYAKRGLIISYLVAENTMETKMFSGAVTDFNEVGLWKDFGGGGSQVETSDEPAEGGEDAFSTGGAYTHVPANLSVDTETEGVVKIKMVNAGGEDVGDEIQFPVGSGGGGGGGSATIVTINFQTSPLYGNAGGSFILRASIRSITTVGAEEQENTINTLQLNDRDTNTLLESVIVNKASSPTSTTYDFILDVSKYFANAGVRRLRLVATDDTDHSASRNINVTAVDVTITSAQTLQYTQSTALVAGGSPKNITLYKFANNASDRGINAITEIFLDGEWQVLGQAIITDTYTHGVSINPSNCLGHVLAHGAYALRVHGVDVASGVVGNYLYTGVFVINESSTTPLVVESWISETANPVVKLYETIVVNYAVYDPTSNAPTAQVYLDGSAVQSHTAYRSTVYTFRHQVSGVASDGTVTEVVKVKCGSTFGVEAHFLVSGSVIDAALKDGAIYAFDFSNRSNEDADHSIVSGGYEITLQGANWSTNGFGQFGGEKTLRIAEDVTASLNHRPFSVNSIENNGLGIQFAFASKNLTDDNAVLMSCFNEGLGAGFYVTGRAVGIYCATGLVNHKEERAYKQGEKVTVAVVVEPVAEGLGQTRGGVTYYFIKLYLNGEEVAVIGYVPGQSNLIQNNNITFDGSDGDFYLFYLLAWEDYFLFDQAFQNYLVKLTDTETMATEYNRENVMASQAVTELGVLSTKLRPQAAALAERGMPYIIEAPYNGSNIEALDETTSTKTKNYITLYYIDPDRPWTNFVAYDVQRRNQGTTSAKRPVKNPRYYLAAKNGSSYNKATKTGGTRIVLLNPDETTEEGRTAIALAAINKVQIHGNSIPVDIITVKVDFSDSSCANDCGVCDQMNATFRALGSLYMTPAQRAFDGTWKKGSVELDGLEMNHSTANFPVAMYRSKNEAGTDPYFHAKGNWKEDKKEQTALGFIDTPGYNKGCLNYGDFIEFYGLPNESLADQTTRFLGTTGLDTSATYVLSQYCGASYKVMKHNGTTWEAQTGSMVQNANGKWTVAGSVVNPIDGFELLNYQGMDWFKGVASLSDMMAASTQFSKWVQTLIDDGDISVQTVPAWTYYFESLVDDDDLAIAYALGKKVPYNLFRWMMFCNDCDYDQFGSDALTEWKENLYRFASPHSCIAYDVFTDYDAAVDQRAKNMQPMWFLEDGCSIVTVNGVLTLKNADGEAYETTSGMMPMRMYLNKVYDCDTCNGKDNDGGQTVDAEVDPNKMPDGTFINPYAGYNSTLFRNIFLQQEVYIDGEGTLLNLKTVASAMRSCTATVDGITLHPFSPEGATHFFLDRRIRRWQKKVSSYDGERKYIDFTPTADTLYFYALQGLGLTSLPAFIERRWRIRDGFYGTGDFFSGVLSGRIGGNQYSTIKIRAAKTGYFGVGNDSSGSLSESVFLEAGEEHTFTQFLKEPGSLLYIYQADRMSEIDLSSLSLDANFDFSVMTLAEKICIGGVSHAEYGVGGYTELTNVRLGELPFLKTIDVRNTKITNVDCSACPRLLNLYAGGSLLTRADIADGSKIEYMQLPASYNYLKLRYLPNLQTSGLVLANAASIQTLIVENNTKIDSIALFRTIAGTSGSQLHTVRVTPVNTSGNGNELAAWAAMNLSGLDANLTAQASPAIVGSYQLTQYKTDAQIAAWQAAFPELAIANTPCTVIVFDDTESNVKNISNLDNETGYAYNNTYTPSGHISAILDKRHRVLGKLQNDGSMLIAQLDDDDTTKYAADGSTANLKGDRDESAADEGDVYVFEPHYWYKGINDYLNNLKYQAYSSMQNEPQDAGKSSVKVMLSALTTMAGRGLSVSSMANGDTVEDFLTSYATYNVYKIDVEGVTVIRFPACVSGTYGAAFANAGGKCVKTVRMGSNNGYVNGDYLFSEVPSNAKWLYFTTVEALDTNCFAPYCVKAYSTDIVAIEPDWVEHEECLCGAYEANCQNDIMRSISGVAATNNMQCGQYTELAAARKSGSGFQCVDYEMSKDVANLFYAKYGTRDSQMQCGYGSNTTASVAGKTDFLGMKDTINPNGATTLGYYYNSGGTLTSLAAVNVMGYENWQGDSGEWMDTRRVGVANGARVTDSLGTARATKAGVWQIKMNDGTTREVQGQTATSNYISKVVNGRFMDVVASYANSSSTTGYADYHYYSGSSSRVVLRSCYGAHANGGVAYAYALYDSSVGSSSYGSRLAFRGTIRWASSVAAYKSAPMAA